VLCTSLPSPHNYVGANSLNLGEWIRLPGKLKVVQRYVERILERHVNIFYRPRIGHVVLN
jgi:hypothetical protein